jgi:hypothetical protein
VEFSDLPKRIQMLCTVSDFRNISFVGLRLRFSLVPPNKFEIVLEAGLSLSLFIVILSFGAVGTTDSMT